MIRCTIGHVRTLCLALASLGALFATLPAPAPAAVAAHVVSLLDRAHALEDNGSPQQLFAAAQQLPAMPEIEDLKLWLAAEAKRQSGDPAGAIAAYERILKIWPEGQAAFKLGLPYVLAQCPSATPARFRHLRGLASMLPTPYQQGRALFEVAKLAPNPEERGECLIAAVKGFRAKSWFYQKTPEIVPVLAAVAQDAAQFQFDADTWYFVLLQLARHGQGALFQKLSPIAARQMGAHGALLVAVAEAALHAETGQRAAAGRQLQQLLGTPRLDPAVRAQAARIAGSLLLEANDPRAAAGMFATALAQPGLDEDGRAECLYRRMRALFAAGDDTNALTVAAQVCQELKAVPVLPIHLYEMALERGDAGKFAAAVPWFVHLARSFPDHYRADDALGYILLRQPQVAEAASLRQRLETLYPNSFFHRWLQPTATLPKLVPQGRTPATPPWVARWQARWRILIATDYRDWAKEEMDRQLARHPGDPALMLAIVDVLAEVGDGFLLTAFAEKAFRACHAAERSPLELPARVWEAMYPRPYLNVVKAEAAKYNLDPYLIYSIMREESHFNPTILSRSNAHGLMQILPSTGKWIAEKLGIKKFKKENLWDTTTNIGFGAWYLRYLLDFFNGNMVLAVAGYNGGQGNVSRKVEQGPNASLPLWERIDTVPMPETRDYYKKVLGSFDTYHRLYGEGAPAYTK